MTSEKSTLALNFLLLLSCLALGTALKNRFIRQDSGNTDAYCSDILNEKFVAAYPQCANNRVENGEYEDFLQYIVCDKTCGILFLSSYFAFYQYKETLDAIGYYMGHCEVNADGRPCYSYIKNSVYGMDEEIALQLCKPSIKYNMCSAKCSSQLRAISAHYGSCINPLFNSSFHHSSDVESLPLFSYQLWTNCGVPIPTAAKRGRAKTNMQH
jgi:hypothetical protein